MSYASQAQLQERFGEKMLRDLTDRATPPAGAIDAAVVNRALADSDAMIDGHLLGRYALPLASTPDLLRDLALTISIYKLHRVVSDEKIRLDYQDALKMLAAIANGTVRLSIAGAEPEGSPAGTVQANAPERPMSGGAMDGFI